MSKLKRAFPETPNQHRSPLCGSEVLADMPGASSNSPTTDVAPRESSSFRKPSKGLLSKRSWPGRNHQLEIRRIELEGAQLPHEAELNASRFELEKAEAGRRLSISKVDQEIEQARLAVKRWNGLPRTRRFDSLTSLRPW